MSQGSFQGLQRLLLVSRHLGKRGADLPGFCPWGRSVLWTRGAWRVLQELRPTWVRT